MDAQGRDPTGKTIEMPLQDKLAPAVFANDPGSDTDPIDGRDAGTVWYAVDAVTRSRDRIARRGQGRRRRRLDGRREGAASRWARADDLVKQLDGGKSSTTSPRLRSRCQAGMEPQAQHRRAGPAGRRGQPGVFSKQYVTERSA